MQWIIDQRQLDITHPDKLYWEPPHAYTKLQVLEYYRAIAPVMLAYMKDRPVTLRFFPSGATGPAYYVRDRQKTTPQWIDSLSYDLSSAEKTSHLLLVDSAAALLWFVNKGNLEFHLWSCTTERLQFPDQAIIDIDPGEQASFDSVLEAALLIGDELEHRQHVKSFPKTSGGQGMHMYVPLEPLFSYEQVHSWIGAIAQKLAAAHPDLISLPQKGGTHTGRAVTIDNGQNALGKNTAAPYTIRANRSGPAVSTPLSWEEVRRGGINPLMFTPEHVLQRIAAQGDLFAAVLSTRQKPSGITAESGGAHE